MSETVDQYAERVVRAAFADSPFGERDTGRALSLAVLKHWPGAERASRLRPSLRQPSRTHAAMSAPKEDE